MHRNTQIQLGYVLLVMMQGLAILMKLLNPNDSFTGGHVAWYAEGTYVMQPDGPFTLVKHTSSFAASMQTPNCRRA